MRPITMMLIGCVYTIGFVAGATNNFFILALCSICACLLIRGISGLLKGDGK